MHTFVTRAADLSPSQRLDHLEELSMEPISADLGGGWSEWQRYVLAELKQLRRDYKALDEKLDRITVEMAVLKTKGTMFGALAGIVASAIVTAWSSWRR